MSAPVPRVDRRHSHATRGTHESRRVLAMARLSSRAAKKLASARDRLTQAAALSKSSALVALSGGKDSLATLDLACQKFIHVEAFYMYLVRGLEVFEAPVHEAARRHGINIHFVPHWDLARLVKHAVLRPHILHADRIRETKLISVETALRSQTGIDWILSGERASDSFNRRFYTHRYDGVNPSTRRCYPIWDWIDAEVYGYLRARHIHPPDHGAFTRGRGVSGFALDGPCLSHLKANHPSDYQRVLKVFPYAEAEIIRYERALEVSELSNPASAPPRSTQRPLQSPQD